MVGEVVAKAAMVIRTPWATRLQTGMPRRSTLANRAGNAPSSAAALAEAADTRVQPPWVPDAFRMVVKISSVAAVGPKICRATRANGAEESANSLAGTIPI